MNTRRTALAVAIAFALSASPAGADELPAGASFSDGPSAALCPVDSALDEDQVECTLAVERLAQIETHERWAEEEESLAQSPPAGAERAPETVPVPAPPELPAGAERAPETTSAPAPSELPRTGVGTLWAAGAGAALLAAGAKVLRSSRED